MSPYAAVSLAYRRRNTFQKCDAIGEQQANADVIRSETIRSPAVGESNTTGPCKQNARRPRFKSQTHVRKMKI